jgi:hypothetical protein
MLEDAGEDGLTRWAAMTAIFFAVLAGLAGILGQNAANAAFELAGKANLDKVEMADQWAFYQARRIKLAVYRTHEDMLKRQKLGEMPAEFVEDIEEYEREGQAIKEKAAALEKSAAAHARAAEVKLEQNDRYDLSVALLQIAIALVSLTVLVRRIWTLAIGVLVGLGGAAVGVAALLINAGG